MEPWFLTRTNFYERVTKKDLEIFRRICPRRQYQKDSHIFRSGDSATELHFIVEGQVKLVSFTPKGKARILAVCGREDFIGEAFLGERNYYTSDAIALTEVATCAMSREQFLQITEKTTTFALTFAEVLADQLLYCRVQLASSHDSVKLRVVKVLLQQALQPAEHLEAGWYELHTELSHDDIAAMLSVTRVAVSKAFADLRSETLVEGSRGTYRLNVPALEPTLRQVLRVELA